MLRRQVGGPPVEDVGDLLDAPEPAGHPPLPGRVLDRIEELAVAEAAAMLDVLLPLRGDLADQVAHREDHVHLGVRMPQRGERAGDLGSRRGGQDLVADDGGAGPLPHLGRHPVPHAVGLGLQPAPRELHQVQSGQELRVEPVGGVEDPRVLEGLLVAEQHVLEVRRAGLRGADVEEDPVGHASSSLVSFVSSASIIRSASANARGAGASTPGRRTGARPPGSPWTA